jgi:hypothetical protein
VERAGRDIDATKKREIIKNGRKNAEKVMVYFLFFNAFIRYLQFCVRFFSCNCS